MIDAARWAVLEPLLDAALDCDPYERASFVEGATKNDPSLRADLEAMLQHATSTTPIPLLERSAGEVFASLLRDDSEFVARMFAESLAGRYTITRRIGAGGMAVVYLAHDIRHDREVAIKILHPDLSAALGHERFLVEIKTTARLQHPHILPLLDSGEAGGQFFYVMPYAEGESLRDRLVREKLLPIEDAVRVASEIGDALEYAHRRGIIHRDIKPENVLLHHGRAMVADFGIALAVSVAGGTRVTQRGISLGTPQYMSPEQAYGEHPIDARSDIYSLGCVLYEMLTGDPPFSGSTVQAIVAKTMAERPVPPSTVRDTVPPGLEAAVLKALAKHPADRFASAARFAAAMVNPDFRITGGVGRRSIGSEWPRRMNIVLAGAAIALLAVVGWLTLRAEVPRPVTKFTLALPEGQGLSSAASPRLAFSSDGGMLAYVGPSPRGHQLWIKRRDQLASVALAGTDGAEQPSFSPDGRRIAFYVRGPNEATVKIIPVEGGVATTLVTSGNIGPSMVSSEGFRGKGLTWGTDDYIYLDGEGGWGVRRISAKGGVVERTSVRDSTNELAWWPDPLPGGHGVLVTLARWNSPGSLFKIAVMDPVRGTSRVLVSGVFARYAASGQLLYVTAKGVLMSAPFDARKGVLTGPAAKILEGLDVSESGAVDLALTRDGTLAYVPGLGGQGSTPMWVRRDGSAEMMDPADPHWRAFFAYGVSLSPDGTRLAYAPMGDSANRALWIKQLPQGALTRLTTEGHAIRPAWRDDRAVLYGFSGEGKRQLNVWTVRADGSAPAAKLIDVGLTIQEFSSVSTTPWVALRVIPTKGGSDLMAIRPGVDSAPRPLLTTPFEERVPVVSPNGRYLAYVSNESGRQEVYVRPFPNVNDGRWQLSTDGGTAPLWSRNGSELFFVSQGQLVSAAVRTNPVFAVTGVHALFSVHDYASSVSRAYDVAPDGRFVMFREGRLPTRELVLMENALASKPSSGLWYAHTR